MKDITRQGIYRIVYDMVKADYIITQDEIDFMECICSEYNITDDLREEALNMSMADAMKEVKDMPVRQAEKFMKQIHEMTDKDGACYREEALLLVALQQCMESPERVEIVSVAQGEIMLDKNQALFIENGFDADVNEYIRKHYSHIVNSLRIGGFDFIYVPKVIEQLCSAGDKLLYSVVSHLAPRKSKEEYDAIVNAIKNQTTERVYRELLLGKLGFDLDIYNPSILIYIGRSMVNGEQMANYISIPLEQKAATQIDMLIDKFLALQKSPTLTIRNNAIVPNAFIYSGFYRILFDLITYRKGVRSYLNVYPYNHKNVLTITTQSSTEKTEEPISIGPKESAFYVFLINETLNHGGFNIAGCTSADIKYLAQAQKRFEHIYFELCNRDTAPDITNSDIRRPMLSKIKKAIESHSSLVQKMMFIPEVNKRRVIKVHVSEYITH